jgi:hypothetical protein
MNLDQNDEGKKTKQEEYFIKYAADQIHYYTSEGL